MTHVHTMIKDPAFARREILNASVEALDFLRSLENLEHIHHKKVFYMNKISSSLRNLKIIQGKIGSNLPNIPKDSHQAKKSDESPQEARPAKKKEFKINPFSEKQRIDQEIRELQRRISGLNI